MKFNEDSEEIMKLLLPLYEKKIKKGINKSKLTAGQLMPLGAPTPWRSKGEREEENAIFAC